MFPRELIGQNIVLYCSHTGIIRKKEESIETHLFSYCTNNTVLRAAVGAHGKAALEALLAAVGAPNKAAIKALSAAVGALRFRRNRYVLILLLANLSLRIGCKSMPLSTFNLPEEDIRIIISDRKFNDNHVYKFHQLVRHFTMFNPRETLYIDHPERVTPISETDKHIQLVHCCAGDCPKCSGGHWICFYYDGASIFIYDSLNSKKLYKNSERFLRALCPFFDEVPIYFPKVQSQPNLHDCGPFSMAFCTSLAFNEDPSRKYYIAEESRWHILRMFNEDCLMPFPTHEIGLRGNLSPIIPISRVMDNTAPRANVLPRCILYPHKIRGLPNPDAVSCYANSSLQSLLHCQNVRQRFMQDLQIDGFSIAVNEYRTNSHFDTKKLRSFAGKEYNETIQQDVPEFMMSLMNESRTLRSVFEHSLMTIRECQACGDVTLSRTENNLILLNSLPPNSKSWDLQSILSHNLNNWCETEIACHKPLDDGGENCSERRICHGLLREKVRLASNADVLIIQFQLFTAKGGFVSKIDQLFTHNLLDRPVKIDSYEYDGSNKINSVNTNEYWIDSMIVHHGATILRGHYTNILHNNGIGAVSQRDGFSGVTVNTGLVILDKDRRKIEPHSSTSLLTNPAEHSNSRAEFTRMTMSRFDKRRIDTISPISPSMSNSDHSSRLPLKRNFVPDASNSTQCPKKKISLHDFFSYTGPTRLQQPSTLISEKIPSKHAPYKHVNDGSAQRMFTNIDSSNVNDERSLPRDQNLNDRKATSNKKVRFMVPRDSISSLASNSSVPVSNFLTESSQNSQTTSPEILSKSNYTDHDQADIVDSRTLRKIRNHRYYLKNRKKISQSNHEYYESNKIKIMRKSMQKYMLQCSNYRTQLKLCSKKRKESLRIVNKIRRKTRTQKIRACKIKTAKKISKKYKNLRRRVTRYKKKFHRQVSNESGKIPNYGRKCKDNPPKTLYRVDFRKKTETLLSNRDKLINQVISTSDLACTVDNKIQIDSIITRCIHVRDNYIKQLKKTIKSTSTKAELAITELGDVPLDENVKFYVSILCGKSCPGSTTEPYFLDTAYNTDRFSRWQKTEIDMECDAIYGSEGIPCSSKVERNSINSSSDVVCKKRCTPALENWSEAIDDVFVMNDVGQVTNVLTAFSRPGKSSEY
ncbi:hypothetical protein QAD02_002820 [Eretmocerus hayati]|uniref:Uncharacterized protein n=1 Tax=Eretmocerus hayati TaxID=131215 RepID=A0ACC2NLR2_9HYME|nr:hypothetical protein QAD02_002820 [Eretmocerus hayati]